MSLKDILPPPARISGEVRSSLSMYDIHRDFILVLFACLGDPGGLRITEKRKSFITGRHLDLSKANFTSNLFILYGKQVHKMFNESHRVKEKMYDSASAQTAVNRVIHL